VDRVYFSNLDRWYSIINIGQREESCRKKNRRFEIRYFDHQAENEKVYPIERENIAFCHFSRIRGYHSFTLFLVPVISNRRSTRAYIHIRFTSIDRLVQYKRRFRPWYTSSKKEDFNVKSRDFKPRKDYHTDFNDCNYYGLYYVMFCDKPYNKPENIDDVSECNYNANCNFGLF